MALETLKDIQQINGHEIQRLKWNEPKEDRYIKINDEDNVISFKLQNGPIKENGVNGCQVDDIISTSLLIIKGLNEKCPDDLNAAAITSLYHAQTCLNQRTLKRKARGVEGTSTK
jgi:hypothetical protein